MSFRPMVWAWEVDGLTPPTKLVLMSLANHANDDGDSCHPSVERIAKEACLSVRSVQYALKWLEEKGYIRIKTRNRNTHQFRLLMGLKLEATRVQDLHPDDEPRVQNLRPRVQNLQFEGADLAPEPRIEPHKEPRTRTLLDDDGEKIAERGAAPAPPPMGGETPSTLAFALLETWNRHCRGIHKLTRHTDARKRLVLKRFKDEFGSDLEQWEQFCQRCGPSDFLNGRGARGWKPTFEWLLKPEKITNVLEGVYDNRAGTSGKSYFADGSEIAPGTV